MSRLRDIVNNTFSIREAYELSLGRTPPSGKCYCPFHHNTNTPAAKVYQTRMVCFSECNRSYDAYDFLIKFRPDLVEKVKSEHVYQTETPKLFRRELPQIRGDLRTVINIWLNEVSVQVG